TFIVDSINNMIIYSYAAVLNDGGHQPHQQPFFNVKVIIDGVPAPCFAYSATAGDGKAGWVTHSSSIKYLSWTSIAIPLNNYIGSNVELEFSVSDCYVTGGNHWAYAYVDVKCASAHITQVCEGEDTRLSI